MTPSIALADEASQSELTTNVLRDLLRAGIDTAQIIDVRATPGSNMRAVRVMIAAYNQQILDDVAISIGTRELLFTFREIIAIPLLGKSIKSAFVITLSQTDRVIPLVV